METRLGLLFRLFLAAPIPTTTLDEGLISFHSRVNFVYTLALTISRVTWPGKSVTVTRTFLDHDE